MRGPNQIIVFRAERDFPYDVMDPSTPEGIRHVMTFKEGDRYVLPDSSFMDLSIAKVPVAMEGYLDNYVGPPLHGLPEKPGTFVGFRSGGLGDILWIMPFLKRLHEHGCKIRFASGFNFYSFLMQQTWLTPLMMPINLREFQEADYWLSFQETVEADNRYCFDVLEEVFGFSIPEKRPYTDKPVLEIIPWLDKAERPIVAIQMESSSILRTWPYMDDLTKELIRAGASVVIFGNPFLLNMIPEHPQIFKPQLVPGKAWDWGYSMQFISRADLAISSDSALVHLAQALGIPTLAFFGPFPSMSRVRDYTDLWVLESAGGMCNPCFLHGGQPCPLAASALGFVSPCLAAISLEYVFQSLAGIFLELGFERTSKGMEVALLSYRESLTRKRKERDIK